MRQRLRGLTDFTPDFDDYERAAECGNRCLRGGVAATSIDMLICAVAIGRDVPILTTDKDFIRYSRRIPIHLYVAP